jgi:hypothetical protein
MELRASVQVSNPYHHRAEQAGTVIAHAATNPMEPAAVLVQFDLVEPGDLEPVAVQDLIVLGSN